MESLSHTLGTIAFFAFIAFVLWLSMRDTGIRKRMTFEAQKQLPDKFSSAEELTRFLDSDAGKQFFERFTSRQDSSAVLAKLFKPQPLAGVLTLLILGLLGISVGISFFIVRGITDNPDFAVAAVVVLLPSLAMLISAGVTYRLKRKWGELGQKSAG